MAITLRSSKSTPLTFNEMDGNFVDLNTRVSTVESNYIKTINGESAVSNNVTLTTSDITESGGIQYYTAARARTAITVVDAGGDGSLAYDSLTGVLTYTGPSAAEVINQLSGGEGIDLHPNGEISGEDATDTNKGIASFNSTNFTLSSGHVSSTDITFSSDSGSAAATLGESFTVTGGEGIDTSATGTTITITAEDASDTNKGVASFSSNDFTVTAGNVVIASGGVDNIQLEYSTITVTGDTGSTAIDLGDTLTVTGGEGIDTAQAGDVLTISAEDATDTNKGIASFNSNDFTVTAGNVVIAAGGVDNAQLANNTITLSADTGSNAIDLGDTLTVTGGEGIDTSQTGDTLTIAAEDASDSNKGIASFSADHFTVTAGAVVLKPDGIDNTLIDFGTGAGQVSTDDVVEGITNLYYTNARADDRIANADLTDLQNVNAGSPTLNYVLTWDGNEWVAAAAPGASGGEANTASSVGVGSSIISTKIGVDLRFRSFVNGTNINIVQNANDLTINTVNNPTFGDVQISGSTVEGTATDTNLILDADGAGVIQANKGIEPGTDSTFNLGAIGSEWATVYADNVTATSLTGTIATASQPNITSLGALTGLLVSGSQRITGQLIFEGATDDAFETYITVVDPTQDNTITLPDVTGTAVTTGNLSAITSTGTLNGLTIAASQTIDAGANKVTNVADPTANQDAATKLYVDSALSSGTTIFLVGADSGSADPIATGETLNISGTGNEIETSVSANTITIGLPDSVSVTNDLTVGGNLTVNGDTVTNNVTNMTVEDNLIELNSGVGSNANDSGIIIERGSTGDNAIFAWDESEDKFVVGTTTATATDTGDLTITAGTLVTGAIEGNGSALTSLTAANISAGNLGSGVIPHSTATTGNFAYKIPFVNTTGTTSGNFGLQIDNGASQFTYNPNSNILTAGTFSGNLSGNVTGNVTGNVSGNLTGNVTGNATTATTLQTTRTIALTGDVVGSATFNGGANATITATIQANSVALGTDTTGNYVAAGAVAGNGLSGSASAEGSTFTVTSNAVSTNTANTIVFRDANGDFAANLITATTTAARYADLAEKYIPDAEYAAGTVVTVGGTAEISYCRPDSIPLGVISTAPAFIMNEDLENGVAVALVGRVPVRVVGPVTKGQAVYADFSGTARATADGSRVGIALETNDDAGEKLVECVLKV